MANHRQDNLLLASRTGNTELPKSGKNIFLHFEEVWFIMCLYSNVVLMNSDNDPG